MKLLRTLPALLLLVACTTAGTGSASYTWETKDIGTEDMPKTEVSLVDESGEVVYKTECTGTASEESMTDADDAETAIRCWFAGGGDDYAVFEADGEMVVRHRGVDEASGFSDWRDMQKL